MTFHEQRQIAEMMGENTVGIADARIIARAIGKNPEEITKAFRDNDAIGMMDAIRRAVKWDAEDRATQCIENDRADADNIGEKWAARFEAESIAMADSRREISKKAV